MQRHDYGQADFLFAAADGVRHSAADVQRGGYHRRRTVQRKPGACGSTTALINVFINLFMGISLGANVLAARYYAAGRDREMSETVHTSIMLALISGVVMAFVGVFFAKGALELMDTPADVIDQSALYMRIYFMGMPFFMLYNYGAATRSGRCIS